ncbi:MAG: hypothetical protein KAV00_08145 [Phycisphaerae bacterium]|nr:hypothetical protein [Phycisphaerae bacterium]
MINKRLAALITAIVAAAVIVPTCLRAGNEPASDTSTRSVADERRPPRGHRMREGKGRPRLFGEDRFTEDKVKEVMAFAKKHFPEEYERLEALRKENPRQFRRAIRRMWWLYKRVRHLPEEIQAAAVAKHRLNIAIFRMHRQILQTNNQAEKAKLKKQLLDLLGKQFDNDQVVKEYKVKRLARELAELKAEIEQRKKDRKKIISKRLELLMKPMPAAGRKFRGPVE